MLPFEVISEKVKPERHEKKPNGKYKQGKVARESWWCYLRQRFALFHAIGRGKAFEKHPKGWIDTATRHDRVIAACRVTKHLAFSFVSNDFVFADSMNVFVLSRYSDFALLQSSIHAVFVWKHASRMKNDLRYTPTDVYRPFPKPHSKDSSLLEALGKQYHDLRSQIMLANEIGLTKLYNRFHDLVDVEPTILKMRQLHKEIDEQVAIAYGWNDLALDYDFYEVDYLPENDRLRYTVSDEARNEILDRLTILNKERYAEEQAEKIAVSRPQVRRVPAPAQPAPAPSPQAQLNFAEELDLVADKEPPTYARRGNQWGVESIDQILGWLEANPAWFTQTVILNACGASPYDWPAAIKELVDDGFVESKTIDGVLRYRAAL